METKLDRDLKQRLLGAVILAAILVILVPEWLDGAGHKSRHSPDISLRDKPVFQPMQQIMPKAVKPPTATATETHVRKRSAIKAWTLQVGSFDDQGNAYVLRDKLQAEGFPAYVDSIKTPKKTSYRVRIGPELDRLRLVELKKKVFETNKLEGMIVNHP